MFSLLDHDADGLLNLDEFLDGARLSSRTCATYHFNIASNRFNIASNRFNIASDASEAILKSPAVSNRGLPEKIPAPTVFLRLRYSRAYGIPAPTVFLRLRYSCAYGSPAPTGVPRLR